MKLFLYIFFVISYVTSFCYEPLFQIARLKYSGGGDWYNDPGAEVNLLKYITQTTGIKTKPEYIFVELSSEKIFNYPFLFLTGHGNISLNEREITNLKKYLENGGFLFVDDDYGLDESFRKEIKKVFPNNKLQEIPYAHPIFHCFFNFDSGIPKIHEHDNKPPQSYGIFLNGRLALFYGYESNISDGWVDQEVYNDPPEKREAAFKMGTNIIIYSLSN